MQNNRMLHISTAGSRKAIQWPGSTMMWSEFTEKLSTPVRGDETLEQYLAFQILWKAFHKILYEKLYIMESF